MKVFTIKRPDGSLVPWTASHYSNRARYGAGEYLLSSNEYHDLGNDRARWKFLYKQGYRCVPVILTEAK